MKALFVTSESDDIKMLMLAWDFWNSRPACRITFDITGAPRDATLIQSVKDHMPDVVFYVGGNFGCGQPSIDTLKEFRRYSKTIHICWDAADSPWHSALLEYKKQGCFDLQVGIDGPLDAPVDMATVTPINPEVYDRGIVIRDICCGFPGSVTSGSVRDKTVSELVERQVVTVRERTYAPYANYAVFMRRCKMILNVGLTGSEERLHVNIKVIETGLAGAVLMEMEGGSLDKWFPRDAIYFYKDVDDAERIIRNAPPDEVAVKAKLFSEKVRTDYTPQKIYGEMLERVGLSSEA